MVRVLRILFQPLIRPVGLLRFFLLSIDVRYSSFVAACSVGECPRLTAALRNRARIVALTDQVRVVACTGDPSSPSPVSVVRWLQVPTGHDPAGGALIPPLRPVLPRSCRTPS